MKHCEHYDGKFLCSVMIPTDKFTHHAGCIFARKPKPHLWRGFLNTVGSVELLLQPRKHCESYGRWVWIVSYPGNRPDIMPNWAAAIAHANYVSRSPHIMQSNRRTNANSVHKSA